MCCVAMVHMYKPPSKQVSAMIKYTTVQNCWPLELGLSCNSTAPVERVGKKLEKMNYGGRKNSKINHCLSNNIPCSKNTAPAYTSTLIATPTSADATRTPVKCN